MAQRRSKQQWLELLDQQKQSGLSAARFCREHNIGQKSFYYHSRQRRQMATADLSPTFLRAQVVNEAVDNSRSQSGISLQHGGSQLFLPATISSSWVAELITALT